MPVSDVELVDGVPVRLVKQIDKPGSNMKTTNSMINGVVGGVCTKSELHGLSLELN